MKKREVSEILGAEHDNLIREKLVSVLDKLGGVCKKGSIAGHAGSQEVEMIEVMICGRRLTIESETYVGLSITGDKELIELVKNQMSN